MLPMIATSDKTFREILEEQTDVLFEGQIEISNGIHKLNKTIKDLFDLINKIFQFQIEAHEDAKRKYFEDKESIDEARRAKKEGSSGSDGLVPTSPEGSGMPSFATGGILGMLLGLFEGGAGVAGAAAAGTGLLGMIKGLFNRKLWSKIFSKGKLGFFGILVDLLGDTVIELASQNLSDDPIVQEKIKEYGTIAKNTIAAGLIGWMFGPIGALIAAAGTFIYSIFKKEIDGFLASAKDWILEKNPWLADIFGIDRIEPKVATDMEADWGPKVEDPITQQTITMQNAERAATIIRGAPDDPMALERASRIYDDPEQVYPAYRKDFIDYIERNVSNANVKEIFGISSDTPKEQNKRLMNHVTSNRKRKLLERQQPQMLDAPNNISLQSFEEQSKVPQIEQVSTSFDYESYKEALAQRESGGDYKAINTLGFLGRYQMGTMALKDAGFIKSNVSNSNRVLDEASSWTGKMGVMSKEDFLNNQGAQENAMKILTSRNLQSLKNKGAITEQSSGSDIAMALAPSHLLGVKGYLSGRKADAYGTTATEYERLGIKSQVAALSQTAAPQSKVEVGPTINVVAPQQQTKAQQPSIDISLSPTSKKEVFSEYQVAAGLY